MHADPVSIFIATHAAAAVVYIIMAFAIGALSYIVLKAFE